MRNVLCWTREGRREGLASPAWFYERAQSERHGSSSVSRRVAVFTIAGSSAAITSQPRRGPAGTHADGLTRRRPSSPHPDQSSGTHNRRPQKTPESSVCVGVCVCAFAPQPRIKNPASGRSVVFPSHTLRLPFLSQHFAARLHR